MNLNRSPLPAQRLAFLTTERERGTEARHAGDDTPAPVPLPIGGSRRFLEVGRQHLPVVLALLLGVVLIAVYALGNSSTTEIPALPAAASSPSPSTIPESTLEATTSPEHPKDARVHVLGAVASPGVVRVPEDSIVEDAIQAAGGMLEDAAPGDLNLAAGVVDGQQIIIGTTDQPRSEVVAPAEVGTDGGVLDLNTATEEQLQDLPGVGPVLAADIVSWRAENGPFTEVSQLQDVTGIGPKTYERLSPLVTV